MKQKLAKLFLAVVVFLLCLFPAACTGSGTTVRTLHTVGTFSDYQVDFVQFEHKDAGVLTVLEVYIVDDVYIQTFCDPSYDYIVYTGKKSYVVLKEAYERGLITHDDLLEIAEIEEEHDTLGKQTATFTAEYADFNEQDRAWLLLDGGYMVFFNSETYGIAPLLAGDKVTVEFTGGMKAAMIYPSPVSIVGKILNVTSERAEILTLRYTAATADATADAEPRFTVLANTAQAQAEAEVETEFGVVSYPQYVVTADGGFFPLSDLEDGAIIYATYRPEEIGSDSEPATDDLSGYKVYAFYAYAPRGGVGGE